MAYNAWFSLLTTSLGTRLIEVTDKNVWLMPSLSLCGVSTVAGLTYFSRPLFEKRRIKSEEEKKQRIEQESARKKSVIFLKEMNKYYNLMVELYDHFSQPISENATGGIQALSDVKAISIPHGRIKLSDEENRLFISNEKDFFAPDPLEDKINRVLDAVDLYNEKYQNIFRMINTEDFYNKNKNSILELISIAKNISSDSRKNIEGIKKFLSNFVNSDNFYEKTIEIKLPKTDGGDEIIKRTVQ